MFTALALLVSVANAGNVNHLAAGSWVSSTTQIPGAVNYGHSIWVDLSVYNLAYEKDVGIVWTDDDWATWHEADAWYEGSLGNNWEKWGIDITPIGTRSTAGNLTKWSNFYGGWTDFLSAPITIEYAVYYRAAGGEWWDNNNGQNYTLTLW